MKTISVVAPPKRLEPRAKKPRRRGRAAVSGVAAVSEGSAQRVFLHDVVNQLTIISLACFELRDPACQSWNDSQRKAIDAIETAIRSAAELAQQLSRILQDEAVKKTGATCEHAPDRTLPANNVYPISPYLIRR